MRDFLEFVASVMDVSVEELSFDTAFGDFEMWDSLMHIRLIMEIEKKYNVEIPIDQAADVKTLSDMFGFVNSRDDGEKM